MTSADPTNTSPSGFGRLLGRLARVRKKPSKDLEAPGPEGNAQNSQGLSQPLTNPYVPLRVTLAPDATRRPSWHLDCQDYPPRPTESVTFLKRSSSRKPSVLPGLCMRCWVRMVVDPVRNRYFNAWDIYLVLLLVTTAFLTPFETAFLTPQINVIFVFDRVVDVSFVVDMGFQFIFAYPDPRRPERLIKEPRAIALNYLMGTFLSDFLSLLPVDLCCVLFGAHRFEVLGFRGAEIASLLRLLRLLRLGRLCCISDRWRTCFGLSFSKVTLLKFFATVILVCHWVACAWGGLAMRLQHLGENNWLYALQVSKGGPDSLYEDPLNVYGISLFWAIVTLTSIGYGDIVPQAASEYWMASASASIMAAIWAYVIGSVCSIVSSLQPHEMHFKRTMDDLNDLLADRGMPPSMCERLRKYFHEAREMNKQQVEEQVIEQMSPMLQGECAMFLHQRWIRKVWYLSEMGNREIIIWAARNLRLMIYAPNEEILEERTLFIVRRGVCALRGKILTSGDIWGEDMLLSNDYLRDRTKARALSYLSVLRLHIADLFDVVVAFPEAKARLRWAQVRIATLRGVVLLAGTLKELHQRFDFDFRRLKEGQLTRLYGDILSGAFTEDKLDSYRISPRSLANAVTDGGRSRLGSADSMASMPMHGTRSAGGVLEHLAPPRAGRCPGTASIGEETSGSMLGELVSSVSRMQSQLMTLEGKVDHIGFGPGLPGLRQGSSLNWRNQRELSVDFGSITDNLSLVSRELADKSSASTFRLGPCQRPPVSTLP